MPIGGAGEVKQESLTSSKLPQYFADPYGWREMAAAVNDAYSTLTPEERGQACILTRNYGEAGAMDCFGKELGLPGAISGHNSCFLWGPQGCTAEVLISVGYALEDISPAFETVTPGMPWSCKYCMPYENGTWIYIARGPRLPIMEAWPTVQN